MAPLASQYPLGLLCYTPSPYVSLFLQWLLHRLQSACDSFTVTMQILIQYIWYACHFSP